MNSMYFFAVFLTILSAFLTPLAAQARNNDRVHIDLQEFPLYIKAGFNPSDTISPDLQDGSWQVKKQWSSVVIRRSGLPGLPKRAFMSPWGRPEQEWTFALPFTLADVPLFPGMFLMSIGDNWEIYLNGALVQKKMHVVDGHIHEQHSERFVFFPINSNLLQIGKNVLVFRIVGDPTAYKTGFVYSSPYYIADYAYISSSHSETLKMFTIAILAILAMYHFLLFAIFRNERYNLLCGIFSLGMSLYYLWKSRWIYQLIPDTGIAVRLEYFTLFFVILALMAYTDKLCNIKHTIVTKIYGGLCLILAVSQLFFSRTYGSEVLIVWQILSGPAIVWIYVYNIILPFNRELKKGKTLGDALMNTHPGNLFIAVFIIVISAIIDILDSIFFLYSLELSRFSMVVFVLSVTLMLLRISIRKDRELKEKSALLEKVTNPASAREKVFNSCGLTEREKEIARLMVEGLDNKDIGERLFISESTIAFHVTNIFRKFGIIDGKNKGRAIFLVKLING